ncbi:hypothetical protein SESBI_40616 [Sesbania bispinosa]|nr:hypothetical protein SESBI_40616 [Sesbania bispinosa]
MCSARVSLALSLEENDQPDRSTKKAKTDDSQETVVEETQDSKKEEVHEVVEITRKEIFPTTIGEGLRRKLISYRDACIGINGASTYYSCSEWETSEDEEGDDAISEEQSVDGDENMGEQEDEGVPRRQRSNKGEDDPLCPTIPVSQAELRVVCQPWRKAILVKLLGKKLGMRFLRQRLLKLWQP